MQICLDLLEGEQPFFSYIFAVRFADNPYRAPIVQHSQRNTAIVVYLTLAVSSLRYARFCILVINDITNYMGIACFTVRKKDAEGHWRDTKDVHESVKTA